MDQTSMMNKKLLRNIMMIMVVKKIWSRNRHQTMDHLQMMAMMNLIKTLEMKKTRKMKKVMTDDDCKE